MNAHQPFGWQFYNPGTFVALFSLAAPAARAKADALVNALRVFGSLPPLGVGVAEGELSAEFAANGRLLSWPLGGALTAAMMAAHRDHNG